MSITIMEVAQAKGIKEDKHGGYNAQQFFDLGLPFFAGCQGCGATLGPDGAYPSKTGYIRCKGCICDEIGFKTYADMQAWEKQIAEKEKIRLSAMTEEWFENMPNWAPQRTAEEIAARKAVILQRIADGTITFEDQVTWDDEKGNSNE